MGKIAFDRSEKNNTIHIHSHCWKRSCCWWWHWLASTCWNQALHTISFQCPTCDGTQMPQRFAAALDHGSVQWEDPGYLFFCNLGQKTYQTNSNYILYRLSIPYILLYIYIYIPGSQLHFICMDIENVDFTLCLTVFYAFFWKCSISQSFNVGADKLDVCPRRKMINLHLPWMAKNVCNILTIGIAVPCVFGLVDN